MRETGKLITCDRCGKQVFLKKIGTTVADGGFTQVETYMKDPPGWTHVLMNKYRDFCPACSEEWDTSVRNFMGEALYMEERSDPDAANA